MTNKSPTDILRKEHEKVWEILDELGKNLENKNTKKLEENITVLEKEFNKHSLKKEETALFPEIEKFVPRNGGPTGAMVEEHKYLVECIKEFKNALKAKDFGKLDESGKHIVYTLRPHIDKENTVLFMMADMHLDDKQKKAVLDKFKKIDSQADKK